MNTSTMFNPAANDGMVLSLALRLIPVAVLLAVFFS